MSGLYSFTGNSAANTYTFKTDLGIIVNVYFYPGDFIFGGYTSFNDSVLHFGINTSERVRNDSRVKRTVIFIIDSLFVSKPDTILIFNCDNEDGYGVHRKRKFNGWFLESNTKNLIKLDAEIADNEYHIKYASIIFNSDNLHSSDICMAFERLDSEFIDKDIPSQD